MTEARPPSGFVQLDTAPESASLQLELYRWMAGAARVAIAFRLSDITRRVAEAGIRRRHPDYHRRQVKQARLRLRLGDVVARQVWLNDELVDP